MLDEVPSAVIGSSPRTRGTALVGLAAIAERRFIPAHAGNSCSTRPTRSCATVHPRARGEQKRPMTDGQKAAGSSPRTRGTDARGGEAGRAVRFIPAHAGNRNRGGEHGLDTAVHPRARGEQDTEPPWDAGRNGSSPRTRGTGASGRPTQGPPRFIPAHAGNSCTSFTARFDCTVHPRARGEQLPGAHRMAESHGSSPRTRGTAAYDGARAADVRFIPAHAGNSLIGGTVSATSAVHPRARGEQCSTN